MICEALRFGALPVFGGLYDQHPQLVDEWVIILQARAEHEAKESKKREAEARRQRMQSARRR